MDNKPTNEWEQRVEGLLQRMEKDELLQEIFAVEPTVRAIILHTSELERQAGYSWRNALEEAQASIKYLVGWYARDRRVAHSKHYAAVMEILRDIVPPDLDES